MLQLIRTVFGWLNCFLGGYDALFTALIIVTALGCITDMMCAIRDRNLSHELLLQGIYKTTLIFALVGVANILGTQVIGSGSTYRKEVIFFYVFNEWAFLLDNATRLGLPVPPLY